MTQRCGDNVANNTHNIMKRLLLFVFAVFAFAACTQDAIEEASRPVFDEAPEFLTVGFEGDDTRIELNALQKTVWTEGDFVSVFYRSDSNRKWQYQGVTGERTGDLKQVYDPNNATVSHNRAIVVYPYSEEYRLNSEDYTLEATLPATQHYHEGSYGVGENLMVAQSDVDYFTLKSVCGWLKIQLTGDGEVVKRIIVRGNDGEQVAGLVYVDTESATLTLTADSSAYDESVILDCGDGVILGEDATNFYIALPPQTFAKGLTVVVECDNYAPMILSRTTPLTIQRNHIQPMTVVEHDAQKVIPYNEIHYTASTSMFKYEVDDKFGDLTVVAHDYNAETGEGVITFSGPVTKIPGSAFAKMSFISSITIPDSVVEIEGYAFSYCSASSINIPDGVRTIGQYAFEQTDITSVVIPDGVTKIDTYVFRACTCLESVTIPSSVESIEWEAFKGCEKLDNLVIPGNVKSVGWAAFSSCSSLKNLTISEGVQEIYANAFNGCGSLESVVIPSTVTSIGSMAFQYCYKLEKVYCKPTIPPGAGDNMFYNADPLIIYVPYGSLSNYKGTYNWSTYKNRMVGCDFSDI